MKKKHDTNAASIEKITITKQQQNYPRWLERF